MHIYRCYFLDDRQHIKAYENIEAAALSEAIDLGRAMLAARPQHASIEIWEGAKLLYP